MNDNRNSTVLGILGGLGPMSSVYFYELITSHTAASCDQDHIDIILSSRATTPDRTAYITGESDSNPLPVMVAETMRLVGAGADIIAMPCNTAHYFYNSLKISSPVPLLNIISLTAGYAAFTGAHRVGILATEGTILGRAYDAACRNFGLCCITPPPDVQALLNDIIYGAVKRGLPPENKVFASVIKRMTALGCDILILGCTELSLLKKEGLLDDSCRYIDSLEVLAACSIASCGKAIRGFPQELVAYAEANKVVPLHKSALHI